MNKMTAAVLKKLLDLDPESFAACSEEIAGTEPPSKRNISATNGTRIFVCVRFSYRLFYNVV